MTIQNGYTFCTRLYTVFTVVYFCGTSGKYGLLNIGPHAEGEHLTAPIFQSLESGQWMFTKSEIQKLLMKWKAKQIDYKLSVVPKNYYKSVRV